MMPIEKFLHPQSKWKAFRCASVALRGKMFKQGTKGHSTIGEIHPPLSTFDPEECVHLLCTSKMKHQYESSQILVIETRRDGNAELLDRGCPIQLTNSASHIHFSQV